MARQTQVGRVCMCMHGVFYEVTLQLLRWDIVQLLYLSLCLAESSWHMQPTLPGCCPRRDAICWAAGEQRGTRKTGRVYVDILTRTERERERLKNLFQRCEKKVSHNVFVVLQNECVGVLESDVERQRQVRYVRLYIKTGVQTVWLKMCLCSPTES